MKKTRSVFVAAAMAASFAFATDYTWNGGGEDNLWTNPLNWGKTAATAYPKSGDRAIFPASCIAEVGIPSYAAANYIRIMTGASVTFRTTEPGAVAQIDLKTNYEFGYNDITLVLDGVFLNRDSSLTLNSGAKISLVNSANWYVSDLTMTAAESISLSGGSTASVNKLTAGATAGLTQSISVSGASSFTARNTTSISIPVTVTDGSTFTAPALSINNASTFDIDASTLKATGEVNLTGVLNLTNKSKATFSSNLKTKPTNTYRSAVTLDNSSLTVSGNLYLSEAAAGGARLTFKGANPVMKVVGVVYGYNNSGATQPMMLNFFVPEGGFQDTPFQNTSTTKMFYNQNNSPSRTFRINVTNESPAFAAGTLTTCPLIAARAGINRYSTLPNLAISPGATLAYSNLTSTAAASSDGSAQVLWATLGGGETAASPVEKSAVFDMVSLSVSRNVISATGYATAHSATAAETVAELYTDTSNAKANMTLVDTAAVTDIFSPIRLSYTAPVDEGEVTHYFYIRFVDKDAGGNVLSTHETSVASAATKDSTTYTWQAVDGVWDGDWRDPAHWRTDVATLHGYPYTSSSKAVFPAGHGIVVTNAENNTVGTIDSRSGPADVTFVGGPNGTNVCLSVSTLLTPDVGGKITLDSAYLKVANDITLGVVELVLTNAAYFYASGNLYHDSYGLILLCGKSYMNLSFMRMANTGTRLIIDDSTLYMRGNIEYAKTNDTTYGGKTTFRGAAPLMLFASGKGPNMRVNGSAATDWVFEIPSGGYASVPVRTSNATVDFPQKYNNGRLRFNVSEDSPCFGDIATFDTPLVAWNGTKSILPANVTTNAIPGPNAGDCYFEYGTGATAGAYGWAPMATFSGTAKSIGVHIVATAHDDRVTVTTENGAAVTACDPDFGVYDGYVAGTTYTFTAPAAETVDGVRYTTTGCTLKVYAAGSLTTVESATEHSGATLEYEFEGKAIEIIWHFAVDYPVTATALNDAGAVVAISGDGHMTASSPVTLTASTATDGMEFQYWYGDLPYESRYTNPLTLAADKAASVTAFFGATKENGATRLASGSGGNSGATSAQWFSTGTWSGGVIPGTNDIAVIRCTTTTTQYTDGRNKRRYLAPSFVAVGGLVVSNACLCIGVADANYAAFSSDQNGARSPAVADSGDLTRRLPIGLDVFGDVVLDAYNRTGYDCGGSIFVGGKGQWCQSKVEILGDLDIVNGTVSIAAGYPYVLVRDFTKRAINDATRMDPLPFPCPEEFFRGGNYLRVRGSTRLHTRTAAATANYNVIHVLNDARTGSAVWLDLQSVTVAEGTSINAYSGGYMPFDDNGVVGGSKAYSTSPGGHAWTDNYSGGGHGGLGGFGSGNSTTVDTPEHYDIVYDYEYSPLYPGNNNVGDSTSRGAGSIRLDCTTLTLDGALAATGVSGSKGGTAGGSIWVVCDTFVPGENCAVKAEGGNLNCGGGGGRIAICEGLADEQVLALYETHELPGGTTASSLSDKLGDRTSVAGGTGTAKYSWGYAGTAVYIVNTAGKKTLIVAADPENVGTPTPAYGPQVFDDGEEVELIAPDNVVVSADNRSRRVCTGYAVTETESGSAVSDSSETSGTLVLNGDWTLTWDLTTLQHAIAVGASEGGAITTNAIDDASSVWQEDGASLSFTAVPASGYVFKGWFGKVERDWIESATITFNADHGRDITALFEPVAVGARVWTGEGDGTSWLDPANWSPAGLPGVAETVTIPAGAEVSASLCAPVEVGSLTIAQGATLTFRRLLVTHTTRGTLPADATSLDKLPMALKVNGSLVVDGAFTFGYRNSYSQFDLDIAGDFALGTNATVTLYAGYAALVHSSPAGWDLGGGRVRVGGALTVAYGAKVKPYCDCIWGAPVVFSVGSARIDENGAIDAYAAGWAKTILSSFTYSGSPNSADWHTGGYAGGTYGGIGGYGSGSGHAPSWITYGNPYTPYMPGSPGMNANDRYGGGAIRIHAEGDFVLNGTLNANGYYPADAGSGGSIWITAGRYRSGATAVVTAAGGDRTGNSGGGGGGRICLAQGLTDEQIEQLYETGTCDKFAKLTVVDLMDAEAERPARLRGTITARGGTNPSTADNLRHYGTDGTAVWLAAQPAGTVLLVQ